MGPEPRGRVLDRERGRRAHRADRLTLTRVAPEQFASKLVNKTGEGVALDIMLGVVGALAGGWLFNQFGQPGVTGLNLPR